jgi:sporulation protein YlmC with PRC-barrel domain
MPDVVLLSKLLGRKVLAPDGSVLGRLRDLTVTVRAEHPTVTGLVVGSSRGSTRLLPWSSVSGITEQDPVRLLEMSAATNRPLPERDLPLAAHELLLARDVVDTQVVDLQDFRLSRVSDLYLACQPDGVVEVAAAEVGFAAVLRRMGLGRMGRHLRPVVVDWTDLHLTSRRGHELQLGSGSAAFHSLDSHGMAELLSRVSTEHATELIRALPPGHAAAVIHHSHPATGRRLIRALRPDDASLLVAAANPAHAPRLAELQDESSAPTRRRLLRTAGWRRYRPSHVPLGGRHRGSTQR